jgi:EmrB/QacA subfamily drug resistance transporter
MITNRTGGPVAGTTRTPGLAASAGPVAYPRRQGWAVLVLLSVAEFMVVLDMTVVNVALPSIGRSLHVTLSDLQWVITAYILLTGGLTLAGGRAADLLGRRRVFLAGLALFTAASLASGLAPSAGALIAARAAQGLGAALLTPAALSVITASYAGAQRATAMTVWGAIAGAGAGAGLLIGGMLTTWLGWRSVFLINVPIGAVAGILVLWLVAPARPGGAWRELDVRGTVLAVGGLASVVYALAGTAEYGWRSAHTLVLLVLGPGLLAAFAMAERLARHPLVPPAAWRSRPLVAGTAVMFGTMGLLAGTFILNTFYLQDLLRASPLRAGLEFLPMVAAVGITAHLASRLLPRAGTRILAATGLALAAVGALMLAARFGGSGYWAGLLPGLLILGAGTGLAVPAASVAGTSEAGAGQEGLASGLVMTGHEVGAAFGVAVFSAIAAAGSGLTLAASDFTVGYRHGFAAAAVAAAVLAAAALLAMPAIRPAPGSTTGLH